MAVIIEDGQFRARDNFGGVMCVDDIDHAVASPVQDSYRALDGPDVKGDPAPAVSQAIIGVALQAVANMAGNPAFACFIHPGSPNSARSDGGSTPAISPRIVLPSSPCASVAAARAAARSGASHTA